MQRSLVIGEEATADSNFGGEMSNQSYEPELSRRGGFAPWLHRRTFPAIVLTALVLTSCTGTVVKQGHLFQDEDVNQIKPGMGKDQVVLALGSPDHQAAAGGAYYYISTTANQPVAFMTPQVTDRRVVAVYFSNKEKVEQVANYGLKDGKVFDFIKRQTPAYSRDQGILKELFRDIGAAPALPGTGGRPGPGN
jgi:outer membrane protein assembly factor BamE (lipoprotein component of BamABCDE complex)